MKKILELILFSGCLAIIFYACEDDEVKFVTDTDSNSYDYEIEMDAGGRFLSYTYLVNQNVKRSSLYNYTDTTAEQFSYDGDGQLITKNLYVLDAEGRAISGIDSIFLGDTIIVKNHTYSYDEDGHLTRSDFTYLSVENNNTSSGSGYINCTFENGNAIAVAHYFIWTGEESAYKCKDEFVYSDIENVTDIVDFKGPIFGVGNSNLIDSRTYESDCAQTFGFSPAKSTYTYETNEQGRVTKKSELYTPGYTGESVEVSRTKSVLNYRYSIN